jgi:hypothetical protein
MREKVIELCAVINELLLLHPLSGHSSAFGIKYGTRVDDFGNYKKIQDDIYRFRVEVQIWMYDIKYRVHEDYNQD